MQLSKNFTLREFTTSQTASRLGLDNTPTEQAVKNLQSLVVNLLQPLRDKVGVIVVSSGYRSPEVNKAVRGSRTSDHMQGFAADIETTSMSNYDLALFIRDNFKFTQVILEFYKQGDPNSGWVHVSYNPLELKQETLTAINQNGRTVYLKGLVK